MVSAPNIAASQARSDTGCPVSAARRPVSTVEQDRAEMRIAGVLALHPGSTTARLRLAAASGVTGQAVVQVNLRVHEAAARVQAPGPDLDAAIEAAADRLDRQIRRLATAWQPWPWPDPRRPPLALPGRRRIARHKTFRLHTGTACQAIAVMNAMDYDVLLFSDTETGQDAVVYRAGPTGLRLARQRSMHPPALPVLLPLTVHTHQPPTLTAAQAATRLSAGRWPFVFYTDPDTGRGNLLYRRYDGDLGLINPAAGPDLTEAT